MRASATLARMRIRSSSAGRLAALLAALLVPAIPAGAANQTVAVSSNLFTPADVTVQQGDTVTWTNSGGLHNVRFDDGSFEMPAAPDSSPWSVSRAFDTVGVFRYYCEEHGYPNGVDMSGAVNVQPVGTPPPPPAGSRLPPTGSRRR